jgi:hypothetical protein
VPDRDLVVVTTSEVSLDDLSRQGIQVEVLLAIVEEAVLAHVPG